MVLAPEEAAAHAPGDSVFRQVGVDEQLGQVVPLQLSFRDQFGTPVRLASYFSGTPVLLSLNYYACPTLCPLVFRNLANTVAKLGDIKLERDFRVVTVSIDHNESLDLARRKSALWWCWSPWWRPWTPAGPSTPPIPRRPRRR